MGRIETAGDERSSLSRIDEEASWLEGSAEQHSVNLPLYMLYPGSGQESYFRPGTRAFLRDAALSLDDETTRNIHRQQSLSSEDLCKWIDMLEIEGKGIQDQDRLSHPATSGHSLAMPAIAQEQVLKGICHAINSYTTHQYTHDGLRAGLPYSTDPVISFKASRKRKNSLRLLLQHVAESFMMRSSARYVRLRKSDADFGYALLSLPGSGRLLLHYSEAYHAEKLPVEILVIIKEVLCDLPPLPVAKNALPLTTIHGFAETTRSFACCLLPLGGSNRVYAKDKIHLPISAKCALQYFGKHSILERMYFKIMHMLRDEFPRFFYHDTLISLGVFILVMVCHEYYRCGHHNHDTAVLQARYETKDCHKALMQGNGMYPSTTSEPPVQSKEQAIESTLPQSAEGESARTRDPGDQGAGTEHLWKPARVPAFSSKTFAGPYGRSEHDVLSRLSRLEDAGKLDLGTTTIGRSVYRYALDIVRKSPSKIAWNADYLCASPKVSNLSSMRQVVTAEVQEHIQKCSVESVRVCLDYIPSAEHSSPDSAAVEAQVTRARESVYCDDR